MTVVAATPSPPSPAGTVRSSRTAARVAVAALVVALLAAAGLAVTSVWVASRHMEGPTGMMGGAGTGPGMMSGGYGPGMMGSDRSGWWLAGDGKPVGSLGQARARAQVFADGLGLRAGEVMQFSDNFYVELLTTAGRGATEVLVDPADGAVRVEYGPAMMWNTAYGMHAAGAPAPGQTGQVPARVSAADAIRVATDWLREHRPGTTPADAEAFPGYYTLHILRAGRVEGMLSVNAGTGAVWYHGWHGRFLAMAEA